MSDALIDRIRREKYVHTPEPTYRPLTRVLTPADGPKLARNVQTKWGYYTAGTPIEIIENMGATVAVCFDPGGHHPANKCHWQVIHANEVAA